MPVTLCSMGGSDMVTLGRSGAGEFGGGAHGQGVGGGVGAAVGQGEVDVADAQGEGEVLDGAGEVDLGLAGAVEAHLDVSPGQAAPPAGAEALEDGLLGGPACGEVLGGAL